MTEINVTIGQKYPLQGKITLPKGEGPFPAVVLVHGSGASDMDSRVYAVAPFKDLAEGLADLGVAAIRYDKRTFTHGKQLLKDYKKNLTVFEETVEDAILAREVIASHPAIDEEKVFVAGLSMGAMLAPRIDAQSGGKFAGLILMAGQPGRIEEAFFAQQDQAIANLKGLMKIIGNKQVAKFRKKFDGLYEMSDEEAQNIKFVGGTTMYYNKEMGMKTGGDYLLESNKPVLVLQGEMDLQSTLKDFEAYKNILNRRDHASFKLYPGLGHVFTKTKNTDIRKALKDYKREGQKMEQVVIEDVAGWVKSHG